MNNIINNLTSNNNHLKRVKTLFAKSDSILIVSPFLTRNFSILLEDIKLDSIKNIHLVSTLEPKSIDQIFKINSIISLIDHPKVKEYNIQCKVSINNRLHGKIYIFKKGSKYISAIISSANFTENGLFRNHEWGVEINNQEEIQKLEKSVLDNLEYENICNDELYKLKEVADKYSDKKPKKEDSKVPLSLVSLISNRIVINNNVNYWLKPIGVTDNPIKEDTLFNSPQYNLHFSKDKPKVQPNDILIAYGVGTTKILSIYRATSFPVYVTEDQVKKEVWLERWPWYVEGENLTTNYGGKWWKNDFPLKKLTEKYLKQAPNPTLTHAGGKTLGALQWGHDKIKLNIKFAEFIIREIMKENKQ